jgi:uncharacterized protein YoaH (UPF0181 family)
MPRKPRTEAQQKKHAEKIASFKAMQTKLKSLSIDERAEPVETLADFMADNEKPL